MRVVYEQRISQTDAHDGCDLVTSLALTIIFLCRLLISIYIYIIECNGNVHQIKI